MLRWKDVIIKFIHSEHLSLLEQSCPKILRVYDEKIEQQEFPRPGVVSTLKQAVGSGEESSVVKEKYALHHKIRNSDTYLGQSISQMDMLFGLYPDDISEQQIEEYEVTLKKAEGSEVSEAEVVMCTCLVSARTLIKQSCNINQVSQHK